MFTGIVQGIAHVAAVVDQPGLRTLTLSFPPNFCEGLAIGASVSCDGVCLTVTEVDMDADQATFDVMQQTLNLTTLGTWQIGSPVNVERAAKEGAEIGGHPLSGHVDTQGRLVDIRQPANNYVLRIAVDPAWMKYIFAKGYIAINGASLTIAEANREDHWFEVWLIPETLRMTTFGTKPAGSHLNIEIERSTQVMVDTVRQTVMEQLEPYLSQLKQMHLP